MAGRVRRKLIAARSEHSRTRPPSVCPLCERLLPPGQADAHHLIPRSQGGRETVLLHRLCHRQVHALLSEAELARDFYTLDALRAHPAVASFIEWVRRKPPEFSGRTRKSQRLR